MRRLGVGRSKLLCRGSLTVLVFSLLVAGARLGQAEKVCPPVVQAPSQAEMAELLKQARDRGALWRLEKDGRLSYLYATVHVGKKEWAMPGPTTVRALREADVIAVELDVSDPAVRRGLLAKAEDEPPISSDLLERLRNQADKACLPWTNLEQIPLAMTAVTLGILAARWDGLDPQYGTEWMLIGFAQATKKPVRSLETVESQRRAIMGQSPEEQRIVIQNEIRGLEQNRQRQGVGKIATAWVEGNLAQLEGHTEGADAERLMSDRNQALAARVADLHDGGKRVFAAIGILHMVGEHALPTLLARHGFKVERVTFAAP